MNGNQRLNDAPVLDQLEGEWQKMAMLILWKCKGREKVTITAGDMAQFQKEFAPGIPVLFTHGHFDSLDFQVVDESAAARIAAHDKTMRGSA